MGLEIACNEIWYGGIHDLVLNAEKDIKGNEFIGTEKYNFITNRIDCKLETTGREPLPLYCAKVHKGKRQTRPVLSIRRMPYTTRNNFLTSLCHKKF